MQAKRSDKMIRAERISFFQAEREGKVEYNPEEDATNNLLEISNQDFNFLELQEDQFPSLTMHKKASTFSQKNPKSSKRVPVAENFTKSHRNWRKTSVNFLSGEEVCVMRKEKLLNMNSFLVFENQDLIRTDIPDSSPRLDDDSSRLANKNKNSKMLINFMRKRNMNYSKEQFEQERAISPGWKRVGSPIKRINQSCQLKRDREEISKPITREINSKNDANNLPEFRSTSPNFRNKKVMNYFKYRLSKNPQPFQA